MGKTARIGAGLAALLLVSACGGGDEPKLMNLRSETRSPDEFAILPSKPLELPTDYAALPTPTPGGANRTDPNPEADAVAALGGNPGAVARAATGPDAAILAQASRYGLQRDIRGQLAAEDLDHRRQNDGRLLERLANVNVYFRAYEDQALDQHAELARWRRAGVRTVSAPPEKK